MFGYKRAAAAILGLETQLTDLVQADGRLPKIPTQPYVHWLRYSIPAAMTQFRIGANRPAPGRAEGEPCREQNSRGQVGYMGPRPPAGDPAHRYHFRIFALDTVLTTPPGATRCSQP